MEHSALTEGRSAGKAVDLAEKIMGFHDAYERHVHQFSNLLIKVDGDHAVSEAYVFAATQVPATDNEPTRHDRSSMPLSWQGTSDGT
jgi:hypothetical protein